MAVPWALVAACVLCATAVVQTAHSGFSERSSALSPDTDGDFEIFIQKHNRTYKRGSAEYALRHLLFRERLARAEVHNSQSGRSWDFDAWNKFGDWTDEEMSKSLGWKGVVSARVAMLPNTGDEGKHEALDNATDCKLPESMHWGHLNSSLHWYQQGLCGSCSAISVAIALQIHHEIHMGTTRSFSPQQMISCMANPEHCGGEGGCQGGFMELFLAYVMKHSIMQEDELPYRTYENGIEEDALQCPSGKEWSEGFVDVTPGAYHAPHDAPSRRFGLGGYERLPINRIEPLMRALLYRGPAIVAVAADHWWFYGHGIFDSCSQDPVVNHAVVLLGFGPGYWSIHNSWGGAWGEDGRIRLARTDHEESVCGMDDIPEQGAACAKNRDGTLKPKPLLPVRVCGTCGLLINPVIPLFESATPESLQMRASRVRCEAEVR